MANTLAAMPVYRSPSQRYPWDTWLDGQVWELRAGEDFDCMPESLRQRAYRAARVRGKRATAYLSPGGIVTLQAVAITS